MCAPWEFTYGSAPSGFMPHRAHFQVSMVVSALTIAFVGATSL